MSLHSFPSKIQCCVLLPGLPDFSGRVTTWKSFVLETYASRNRPLLACRRVNPPVLRISKCHNCVLFSCRGRVTTRKSRLGISCASRKRPLACCIRATTLNLSCLYYRKENIKNIGFNTHNRLQVKDLNTESSTLNSSLEYSVCSCLIFFCSRFWFSNIVEIF